MNPLQIDAITARLERLECENRRLKLAGGLAAVAIALLVAAGAKLAEGPKVVEAERFVVRDANGKERAVLGVRENEICDLVLRDGEGRTRAALGVAKKDAAMLFLWDEAGKATANLTMHEGKASLFIGSKEARAGVTINESSCDFSDPAGRTRASLSIAKGVPTLLLNDGAGQPRVFLHLLADGTPSLRLMDQADKAAVHLAVSPDGASQIILSDKRGEHRSQLIAGPGRLSMLRLLGRQGGQEISLNVLEEGSALSVDGHDGKAVLGTSRLELLDEKGKVRFRAPSKDAPEARPAARQADGTFPLGAPRLGQ